MKNVWTESCRLRLRPAELHLEPESAQGQAASSDGASPSSQHKHLITRCSSIIKPWHYRTLGIKEVSDDWQCWCVHFKRMYSKWNWNFQKRKLPNEEWSQNFVTCCEFSTWILYPNKTENSSASVIRRSKWSNAFKLAVNTTELPLKRQTALRGAAGCTSLSYICLRSPQLAVIYILITQMERRVHIQRRDAVWFSVPKKWAQAR